jgi:hypothetical protein
MRKISNLFKGINILTIISTSVAIASLYIAFINKWPLELFPKTANFSCDLISNPDEGEVWTVMYRKDDKEIPWLKIEATMGSNWTPAERCQAIAQRLEIYRQDGLTQLTYRSDPSTPKQYVICAKTKVEGDNCHLLLTLKPNIDPYESLRYMTKTLTAGTNINVASQSQGRASFSNTATKREPLVIDLEKHLSDEDRKAGNATQ